ncbi:MAG: Kazal-type serine protease inhibitor domain protein [Myxococcaceae bacterium]|nr:Kazal-type serine protease inhibitor domain protein [Myxococcaceae bacterium]
MNILRPRHFIALTGLVLGCGSSVTVDPHTADAGSTATDVGRTGDTPQPDIGAAVDTGPALDVPGPCTLPNGRSCAQGQVCPAGDDCNTCVCSPATGLAVCTMKPCVAPVDGGFVGADAGPGACDTARDCGPDRECRFTTPGCGVTGTCGFISDCAAVQPYCSCAGQTFLACPTAPERAWVTRGACASDGGAAADVNPAPDSAACGGASIGPGGRYCAGPTDRPLPLTCCTGWNCDQRLAACNSLPPSCPPGEVASVAGLCWGPCVPATHCAPIACTAGGGCPGGWTCNAATATCRYGA